MAMKRILVLLNMVNAFVMKKSQNGQAYYHVDLHREVLFKPERGLLNDVNFSASVDFLDVPLGVGMGTHYAEFHFGVPPQKSSVIVDTGSHLTATPCSSCKKCGTHTDPPYDLALSTTVRYLNCTEKDVGCKQCVDEKCYMQLSYSEGSMWKAVMVEDLCWLGEMNEVGTPAFMERFGVPYAIGCQIKETGLFITQKANGIMGFADSPKTLVAAMVEHGKIDKHIFAMCFGAKGGMLSIGGVDHSVHLETMRYVPYTAGSSGWYTVKVMDLQIAGISVSTKTAAETNRGRGCIVDSGTTETYLPERLKDEFHLVFKQVTGRDFFEDDASATALSLKQVKELPAIQIHLQGMGDNHVILEIPATQYLTLQDTGKYVANFHFSEYSGSVLGASTMMNYNVVFDKDNHKVGFARANCGNFTDNSDDFAWTRDTTKSYFAMSIAVVCSIAFLCFITICVKRACHFKRHVDLQHDSTSEEAALAGNMSTREISENVFTIDDCPDDASLSPTSPNDVQSMQEHVESV